MRIIFLIFFYKAAKFPLSMQKIKFLQSKIDNPLMHSQKDYSKSLRF